jgi:hypothetical protein
MLYDSRVLSSDLIDIAAFNELRISIQITQNRAELNLQLLPRKNETNLIHLNPLFFLKSLLDSQDLIFWLKVEALFTAGECFDKDLLLA